MPDLGDTSVLPVWLQIAFWLGGLIAGAVVVRMGYRKPKAVDETPPTAKVPGELVGIGTMLADNGSALQVAASLDKLTAVLARGVNIQEERWASEKTQARENEIRADTLDDLRRAGRLKDD